MHQTGGPSFGASLVRRILDQPYDVIHYHNVSLMGGPEVLTYGNALKLYHGPRYWLVCPTHVLYRYQREPCARPTCLSCTLAHHRPPQLWRYTNKLASAVVHVDAFLALSQFSIQGTSATWIRWTDEAVAAVCTAAGIARNIPTASA